MHYFLLFLFTLVSLTLRAQPTNVQFDEGKDTLLIVCGTVVTDNGMILNRNLLIENDSILINKSGLSVESFTFSAFSLGQKISLRNQGNVFSDEVKYQLTNKESIFKFFYLKDIILRTDDGLSVPLSNRSIKITFSN